MTRSKCRSAKARIAGSIDVGLPGSLTSYRQMFMSCWRRLNAFPRGGVERTVVLAADVEDDADAWILQPSPLRLDPIPA